MQSFNLNEPKQAYDTLKQVWKKILKPHLLNGSKQVMTITSYEEALTNRQRKYYHGVILVTIANQVDVQGRKYPLEVWKQHYRQKFLGDKVVEVIDVMTGATRKELQRVSSESLSVKGYNELIEKVTADAATEFGVVFDVDFAEWEQHENNQT
jgi:ATP-dependent DNA ligase